MLRSDDVANHFIMHGGPSGHKASYDSMVSRMLGFVSFVFDARQVPEIQDAIAGDQFVQQARLICGQDSVLDDEPVAVSLVTLLPGQEVPTHIDNPWFWGGTRWDLPTWLLLVMARSGLYRDIEAKQVQGVAYINRANEAEGGQFFWYHHVTRTPEPHGSLSHGSAFLIWQHLPHMAGTPAGPAARAGARRCRQRSTPASSSTASRWSTASASFHRRARRRRSRG